ncbi:MAG TPA: hypothetical protein VH062_35735 [Polyangiaceae bacterium]|nr:hypothetical protein [Polyangiaceae bacterium]
MARSSLTLVVGLGLAGCVATSSYQPANSPRVSIVDDHGAKVYKNGQRYRGLLDAVADNPRALEEARKAHTAATWGNWLFLGSSGLLIAGTPTFLAGQLSEGNNTALTVTGLSLMSASVVASIVAGIMVRNGEPHVLDAINIYNDDVEAQMCVKRPPSAPAGAPATRAAPR